MSARSIAGVLLGLLLALGLASPVAADPAGPTDYLSEVTSIDPPTPEIDVEVLGGDSFVELVAQPGVEVLVLGYRGEPYLRIDPDGSVWENRRSPAKYLNEERYGNEFPPEADHEAEPEWEQIGSGGSYAWHDHRAHWMQPQRPAGGPGDQILEGVIPLFVDGVEVDVTVVSTWQPAASRVPVYAGIALGVAVTGAAWWLLRRRIGVWTAVVMPVAVFALVVGAAQFFSLPPSTGPRVVWLLLPLLASLAASVAVFAGYVGRGFVATAATLVAGVQLAMWGVVKRDGLTAALIPTDAPGWVDRLATSTALVGGLGLTLIALWDLFGRTVPARAGSGSGSGALSGSRAPTG